MSARFCTALALSSAAASAVKLLASETEGTCPGFGGDQKCTAEREGSYCKYYQYPPVCYGSDTPCACGPCLGGDDHCRATAGSDSYCKFWLQEPVCHGNDQPCGCQHSRLRRLQAQTSAEPSYNAPEDYTPKPTPEHVPSDDYDSATGPDGKASKHYVSTPVSEYYPPKDYKTTPAPGYTPNDDTKHGKPEKWRNYSCHWGDSFCKARTHSGKSFCEHWKSPSTCYGDDSIKCGCKPQPRDCQAEDARCAKLLTGSYCTYWLSEPRCHGTHEPCKCKPRW